MIWFKAKLFLFHKKGVEYNLNKGVTVKEESDKGMVERMKNLQEQEQKLRKTMDKVKHKIAIISGKGGVGKSTVTANLAVAFAGKGYQGKVGVLDADIHGPCIPKILGVQGERLPVGPPGIFPVTGPLDIKIISMAFLLQSESDPVIWRGPLKMVAIRQFLTDIQWGSLEYLFIDLPPGTGDEPLSVMQLLPDLDGVVIVTIPSEVSQLVVKKAITFARHLNVPIIGVIENMSGFICPNCGTRTEIFSSGGVNKIADELKVTVLGTIPLDPRICKDSDLGLPFILNSPASDSAEAFMKIVKKVEDILEEKEVSN
jgi:ATP-binding protein involved in chromosome partitioning